MINAGNKSVFDRIAAINEGYGGGCRFGGLDLVGTREQRRRNIDAPPVKLPPGLLRLATAPHCDACSQDATAKYARRLIAEEGLPVAPLTPFSDDATCSANIIEKCANRLANRFAGQISTARPPRCADWRRRPASAAVAISREEKSWLGNTRWIDGGS